MKKILIYGLKEPIGGVERIITSYTENFPVDKIICDYIIFGDEFSLEKEITKKCGKVFYLPNRVKNFKEYSRKINKIFSENKYDAIWANFSGLTNIDFLKLGKKYGVPIRVAHSHVTKLYWTGIIMKYLVPVFHYINKRKINKYATDFWACSKIAGEFMFPAKVHSEIVVINNAVDTSKFYCDSETRVALRKELDLETNFIVGHIARMSSEKNQEFMLEIFKEFLKKKPEAKLLFVGDGELKEPLIEKAKNIGVLDNCVFTGFKSDVERYYKASDVFLFPSIAEGLGLSLIEAQACGVPCVVSNAVPKEADITGCVKFLGLDEPLNVWCDAILEMSEKKIIDAQSAVREFGYDIKREAEKVLNFFINKEF